MAWTASAMFQAWAQQMVERGSTEYTGLDSDTVKVALYDNDITPDKDAAVASTGFNTGQWVTTGNEVTDTNWPTGGNTLAGKVVSDEGSGITQFDATDLSHTGTVTLANVYGCFVYDDTIATGTVADQGITYHFFGGGQSVTSGTFTIVWHANGLFRITV